MIRQTLAFLAAFFVIILMSSCQKELSIESSGTSNPVSPVGDWKFMLLDVKSTVGYSESASGITVKLVALTNVLTKKNTGTLKIDATVLDLTGFSYSVDTVSKISTYLNGILVDQVNEPIQYDAPLSSTASEYKLIGSDSMYFPNADFIQLPDDLALPPVTGLKYKIEGNKLKFNTTLNLNETDNSGGTVTTLASTATLVMTFERQ